MPPPVQNVVPNASPINFHNDLAEGDDYGCFLRYETNGGTIDTLTVHDCTTGYKQQYCINITLQTANLYGTRSSDYGIFLPVESARGFVALNDNVSGYPVGFLLSEEYTQTITGGTWNNEINLEIPNNIDARGRTITITNPVFARTTIPSTTTSFGQTHSRTCLPETLMHSSHRTQFSITEISCTPRGKHRTSFHSPHNPPGLQPCRRPSSG